MNHSKAIFLGDEGSGKTLAMSEVFVDALKLGKKYKDMGLVPMMYGVTYEPSDYIVNMAQEFGLQIYKIENYDDLLKLKGGYFFIDEMEVFLDGRKYADLPVHVRRWFAQADKNGIRIYGTAQNYMQIDISFRRLCKTIYFCSKLFGTLRPHETRPSKGKYWGIFYKLKCTRVYHEGLSEPQIEMGSRFFDWSLKFYTSDSFKINDTGTSVLEVQYPPLRKVVRVCPEDGYKKITYV